jgi:hypothetical protein
MKSSALRISWIPLVLAMAGCGGNRTAPTTGALGELDGEVFIVTQGAESVKLGLVEVRVLPYEATVSSVAQTTADAQTQMAILQPKLEAAQRASTLADARGKAADADEAASENASQAALDQGFRASTQHNNALDTKGHFDVGEFDAEEKRREAAVAAADRDFDAAEKPS